MDKYFKITDLKLFLHKLENDNHFRKYFSLSELIENLKEVNRELIYNLDEIISDLKIFISKPGNQAKNRLFSGEETCKILKINRSTIYYWRTNNFIRYAKLNNILTRYKLPELLEDLEKLQKSNEISG